MSLLSEHFSLEELTRSETATRHGIPNTPNRDQAAALGLLCVDLLEPARALLGVPLQVSSGFRCPDLNARVGGQPNSAHLDGRAADFIPIGLSLDQAYMRLAQSDLPFDQLILEAAPSGSRWIHFACARLGEQPRRQAFHLTKRPQRRAIG